MKFLPPFLDAGVIVKTEAEDGTTQWSCTVDLPDDFALDQPLSPFLLAALELLDPESDSYALDLISMIEATLEGPMANFCEHKSVKHAIKPWRV